MLESIFLPFSDASEFLWVDFLIFLLLGLKRKDKLREHMQRMHNPDREAKKADRNHRSKAVKGRKVAATDFESFMFKCRLCMMGFRRRGMLVGEDIGFTH